MIPALFEARGDFTKVGLATAKLDGKSVYINSSGDWVIAANFDSAFRFSDIGLAKVRQGKKWGVIDQKGRSIVPNIFDKIQIQDDYISVQFGKKSYPILLDGTLIGFEISEVESENLHLSLIHI